VKLSLPSPNTPSWRGAQLKHRVGKPTLGSVPVRASTYTGQHKVKGKGKVVPVFKHHAMKAYWRRGGIAPRILWPRHYMEASAQLHAPVALPPGKEPLVPTE
jgi:hypothetical protein